MKIIFIYKKIIYIEFISWIYIIYIYEFTTKLVVFKNRKKLFCMLSVFMKPLQPIGDDPIPIPLNFNTFPL